MGTIDYKAEWIKMEKLLSGEYLNDDPINPKVFKTEQVHISQIKGGDLIINMKGQNETVCFNSITYDPFWGTSVNGFNFWGGHLKVTRYLVNSDGCLIPINNK